MPSMPSSTSFARSPIAAQATPKKIENTTICKISLSTIGRIAEFGEHVLDETVQRHGMRIDARTHAAGHLVHAHAGLEQVDQDESERERHHRGADEPQHGLATDPPDRPGVGHVADADDQGREYQWRDDHLDQPQKDHAAERNVAGERLRVAGLANSIVDRCRRRRFPAPSRSRCRWSCGSTSFPRSPGFPRIAVTLCCCNRVRRCQRRY